MRLLLRANSHRRLSRDSFEIAAAPDTPRRERWQWQLRVLESPDSARASIGDPASDGRELTRVPITGTRAALELTVDPATLTHECVAIETAGRMLIERELRELLVLVVGAGAAVIDGRYELKEFDALVLEGDDPRSVIVEKVRDESLLLGSIRLAPRGSGRVCWVP